MLLYILIDLILRGFCIYLETNQEIFLFILTSIAEMLFKMPYRRYLENFALKKALIYYQCQLDRYSNLSTKAKEMDTVTNFKEKLDKAVNVVQTNWTWRIEIVSEVLFGFYFMNIYGVIFYIAWYFIYIRYEIEKLTSIRKSIRKERTNKQDYLRLNFNKLHCDESYNCIEYKRELEELNLQSYNQHTKVQIMQRLPIFVSFLIIRNYLAVR